MSNFNTWVLEDPLGAIPYNEPPVKDMKFDDGKLLANIPFEDFPLAIKELIRVCTFGAQKYSRSSWKTVSNAEQRYNDARARHFLETEKDEESGLYHLAHEAWNCLALLQMKLEKIEQEKDKQAG